MSQIDWQFHWFLSFYLVVKRLMITKNLVVKTRRNQKELSLEQCMVLVKCIKMKMSWWVRAFQAIGEKMTEVLKNGEIADRSFKLLIKSKFLTKKMVDTNSGKNIIFSFWTQRNLEVKINTNSIKIMYSKNFYSFCNVSHFQILNLKIFFHFFLW